MELDRQRMLADIAHDLKTPISTLFGYAKALHEGMVKDPDNQKSYLLSIYNKAKRVNALLDTLFEMTQLDHPEFILDKKNRTSVNVYVKPYWTISRKSRKRGLNWRWEYLKQWCSILSTESKWDVYSAT